MCSGNGDVGVWRLLNAALSTIIAYYVLGRGLGSSNAGRHVRDRGGRE